MRRRDGFASFSYRPPLALALALLAALAVAAMPGQTAVRLTLKLDAVTLHEALQRLQNHYGWELRGADGSGRSGFLPPTSAQRASFDWREAAVGVVFRDLAAAYGQTARQVAPRSYLLDPSPRARAAEMMIREGVAITLRRVRQEETRTQVLGAPNPSVERDLSLGLSIRPLAGDPEVIHGLERLRAVDDRGNELRPATPGAVRRVAGSATDAPPDEWRVELPLEGLHPRAGRLEFIEGEVVLYRVARTYRLEAALPGGSDGFTGKEWQAGPVRVNSLVAESSPTGLRGGYVVIWPRDVEVSTVAEPTAGLVAPLARLRSGKMVRAPVSFGAIYAGEDGRQSARMLFDATSPGEEIAALVWDVVVKSEPDRRVPFRFQRIPLPLGGPASPPVTGAEGKVIIAVRTAAGPAVGELAVGLGRRTGAVWGPVRWVRAELDGRGEATVGEVAPGVYQVSLRFRARAPDGTLGVEQAAALIGPASLSVARGKTSRAAATLR